MITFTHSGSFKNTESFLKKMSKQDIFAQLEGYAAEGVAALAKATPKDSSLAARSWTSKVTKARGSWTITWMNTDIESGFPVAIMLQYGYGTGTGGYVQGRDYINPAIKPIFEKISNNVWKAVTSA